MINKIKKMTKMNKEYEKQINGLKKEINIIKKEQTVKNSKAIEDNNELTKNLRNNNNKIIKWKKINDKIFG